jgi:hypothetical protein
MPVPLAVLVDRYVQLPGRMRELFALYPGARVVRNDVGNLAVLNADDTYVAWIDTLTGEVEIV